MAQKLITPFSGYPVETSVKHSLNYAPDTLPCTFLGEKCQQSFNAFFIWEKILTPLDFKRIIEIGTAKGNTSVYFKMFCINRNASFYTYDFCKVNQRANTPVQRFVKIEESSIIADVFKRADDIMKLIKCSGTSIVFCDGGDKPHELRTFAPALKKGDIIACHDWGRAIKDEWVFDDIKKFNLKEIYREERIKYNTVTGIFVKE